MLILIGGGGFLGSHARQQLASRADSEVLIVGRREPAMPLQPHESWLSADEFAGDAGAEPLRRANAIIYLASTSTVATHAAQPWQEPIENVVPVLKLGSRVAQINPGCRLVFVSSGGTIYGDTGSSEPIPEDQPCRPISPYGLGKLMAEQSLRFLGRTEGLDYRILRVSNPVGRFSSSAAQGLVGVAINALLAGKPITLFGDGSAVRDLVDADEAVRAMLMAAVDARWPGATWNIGSGVGISNCEVLELVGRVAGSPVAVQSAPARAQDVKGIVLDCRRAGAELGWTTLRPIEQTIAEIWKLRTGGGAASAQDGRLASQDERK